jgi:hypothetical protein
MNRFRAEDEERKEGLRRVRKCDQKVLGEGERGLSRAGEQWGATFGRKGTIENCKRLADSFED